MHLDAVAAIAKPFGAVAVTIAYLHDVVEDTPVSLETIEAEFNQHVAECVGILTDEPGEDRASR